MNLEKAILVLEEHNKWRRGDDSKPMLNPAELGIAIDVILKQVKNFKHDALLENEAKRSELFPEFLYKDDDVLRIGYHGDSVVDDEWNDYLKKLGNCF